MEEAKLLNDVVAKPENTTITLDAKQLTSAVAQGVALNFLVLVPCTLLTIFVALGTVNVQLLITVTADSMLIGFMYFVGNKLAKACQGPVSALAVKKSEIFVSCAGFVLLPLLFFEFSCAFFDNGCVQEFITMIAAAIAYSTGQVKVYNRFADSLHQDKLIAELKEQ